MTVSKEPLDGDQMHRASSAAPRTPAVRQNEATSYLAFFILPWCSANSNLEKKAKDENTNQCLLPFSINFSV